ncbi:hypothetical protein ABPG75_003859 [Micractinium tetrahymenae]
MFMYTLGDDWDRRDHVEEVLLLAERGWPRARLRVFQILAEKEDDVARLFGLLSGAAAASGGGNEFECYSALPGAADPRLEVDGLGRITLPLHEGKQRR